MGTNANRMVITYPTAEKMSASCNLALSVTNIALSHAVRELKRMPTTIGMMLMSENDIAGMVAI